MDAKIYIETPCPDSDDRKHENNINHYSVFGLRMLSCLIDKAGFRIDFPYNLSMPVVDSATKQKMNETAFALVATKTREIGN